MSAKSFRSWVRKVEADPAFWTEKAILRVGEEIYATMESQRVTRAELARRLGTSPAYVTKILRGNANFTLESLARIAHALGGEFQFHIAPRGVRTSTKTTIAAPAPKAARGASRRSTEPMAQRRG